MGQNPLGFFAQNFLGKLGGGRIGVQTDLWTSQRHGKHYDAVYGTPAIGSTAAKAGSVFRGASQAGATLSNALATTYVGLCLSNPAASGVNLVVKRVTGVLTVAPTGFIALGLITGWSAAGVVTHTTSLNADIISAYVGGAASGGSIVAPAPLANLDAACTIVGTPLWDRWLVGSLTTANPNSFNADLDDNIIVPPGGYVAVGANEAGPTSGFWGSFMWEELPQ